MSIEIYKVNNLFTIKRVSVYVQVDVYRQIDRWMDGMFWWWREQDGVGDGVAWKVVRWWMDWGCS